MTFGDDAYIRSAVEALLFVSDTPVAASSLAEVLGIETAQVRRALVELQEEKRAQNTGVQLREVAGGWQLVTHAEHHDLIEKYVRSWERVHLQDYQQLRPNTMKTD